MNALLLEYLPILIFIGLALVIGIALLIAPLILAPKDPNPEKLSAYECGFNASSSAILRWPSSFPG